MSFYLFIANRHIPKSGLRVLDTVRKQIDCELSRLVHREAVTNVAQDVESVSGGFPVAVVFTEIDGVVFVWIIDESHGQLARRAGTRVQVFGDINPCLAFICRNMKSKRGGDVAPGIGRDMRRGDVTGIVIHPLWGAVAVGVVTRELHGLKLQIGRFRAYHLHFRHSTQQVEVADVDVPVGVSRH